MITQRDEPHPPISELSPLRVQPAMAAAEPARVRGAGGAGLAQQQSVAAEAAVATGVASGRTVAPGTVAHALVQQAGKAHRPR